MNTVFDGFDSKSMYDEAFRRRNTRGVQGNRAGNRTGLQCAESSVNSPIKAWRQVFTNALLDKIVSYTNQYGLVKCKDWSTISRHDLTNFFPFYSSVSQVEVMATVYSLSQLVLFMLLLLSRWYPEAQGLSYQLVF